MIIAIAAVIFGLVGRRLSRLEYSLNDLTILLALITIMAVNTCELVSLKLGYVCYLSPLPERVITPPRIRAEYPSNLSRCSDPHRNLFTFLSRPYLHPLEFLDQRYHHWILQIILGVANIACILATCKPISRYWEDPFYGKGCVNVNTI